MRIHFYGFAIAVFLSGALLPAQGRKPLPPTMAVAPAGEFEMGSDRGASWEGPAHRVRTPEVKIAARPVTNAEFALFRPGHSSPGNTDPAAPVTGVSWQDAADYCVWLGEQTGLEFQLPREAWWERAVRGGLSGKTYPWGDQPLADGAATPKNDFGVYAVGFNLWEWTADWYSPNYFAVSPVLDPSGPERGVYRVLRGGGYRNDPASATVYNRGSARPDTHSAAITFRVALTPEGAAPASAISSASPPPVAAPQDQPNPRRPPAATPSPTTDPTAAAAPKAPSAPVQAKPRPRQASKPAVIAPLAADSLAVGEVSFEVSGNDVIVTVATASKPAPKKMVLSSPDRVVIDIPGGDLMDHRKGGQIRVGQNGVNRIRYSQFKLEPPAVRIVIDLDGPLASSVESTDNEIRVRLRP